MFLQNLNPAYSGLWSYGICLVFKRHLAQLIAPKLDLIQFKLNENGIEIRFHVIYSACNFCGSSSPEAVGEEVMRTRATG